jgi:glycerophosphoryl diester phosphodiesterase
VPAPPGSLRLRRALLTALLSAFTACSPTFDVSQLLAIPEAPALIRETVAHRGSLHEGLPDNSLPALADSARRGVRYLEVDVRLSREGPLFLFHDGSLRRENSSGPKDLFGRPVQELSLTEIAQIRLDPAETIGVPLLSEALKTLAGTATSLQLDLKGESDELLHAVVTEIAKAHASGRVVIQIRSPARVARLRRSHPSIRILARCKDDQQLDGAIAAGVDFVELERWITADGVARAHRAKIPVLINVAGSRYDEPEMWRLLRSRGVDLIMTNHALAAK